MTTRSDEGTPKCRPIIVLGAERSGTSLVAAMIHRWGAYAGESEALRGADEHNLQGYWEYKPLWDFLVELGDLADGVSWWDASFQERVRQKLFKPQYRDRAGALIAEMEQQGRPWIWKDPALSFFLPFWKQIWGDAIYIVMVRHPYDTARSWQEFTVLSPRTMSVNFIASNLLRWQSMMLHILEQTDNSQSKIFIAYEGLLQHPWKQAQRLCDFLNRGCEVGATSTATVEGMAATVNPKLCHYQSNTPLSQIGEATDEQRKF